MKTIELSEIFTLVMVLFMDSLDELGCQGDVREWFDALTSEQAYAIGEKLLEIIERDENGQNNDTRHSSERTT
jgi:hypothetical protein